MPITNALLVRAAYGWDEVTRPSSITTYSRREALYGLGANASPVDVDRTANARLDIVATPRFQYDAEHQPFSLTDLAYRGYGVGDTLPMTVDAGSVTERVISLAVSEDDNSGQATVTASLHDVVMYASPLENFVAMLSQAVKKMIPGTGRGDWKEAQPVTPPAIPAPVSAWVPPIPACVTESFDTADSDTLGPDQTWTKDTEAIDTLGSGTFNPTGLIVVRSHRCSLVAPTAGAQPWRRLESWCLAEADVQADLLVGVTVAGIGTPGTSAGQFDRQGWRVLARAGEHTGSDWSSGLLDGWEFLYTVFNDSTRALTLTLWQAGASTQILNQDIGDPSTLAVNDTLSIGVTGSGSGIAITCKQNATTLLTATNADLVSAGVSGALPVGVRGAMGMFGRSPSSGWVGGNDDQVALDDFSACPA